MYAPSASVPASAAPLAIPREKLNPRLETAAHQFEASLMQELLKPLNQKGTLFSEVGEEGGSGDAVTNFGSEALAQAISAHGGLGIASEILRHLGLKTNEEERR